MSVRFCAAEKPQSQFLGVWFVGHRQSGDNDIAT